MFVSVAMDHLNWERKLCLKEKHLDQITLYNSNRLSGQAVHKNFTAAVTPARITWPHWVWYTGQALSCRLQFIAVCFSGFFCWFFFSSKGKIPQRDGIITTEPNFQPGWTALACKFSQPAWCFPFATRSPSLNGTAASLHPTLSAVGLLTKPPSVNGGVVTSWTQKWNRTGLGWCFVVLRVWFLQRADAECS